MKRIRHSAQALLFVLSMLTVLVVSSGTASATSAYDGSYQSAASVRSWWSSSGCDPVDMTFDWSSYVLNEAKWPPNTDWSAHRTSLLSALNNGSNGAWGVTQFHTSIADVVEVYWTEDASAYLEWSGDGVDVTTTTSGGNIHVIDIACSQKFYGVGGATPVGISYMLAHSQRISTSTTWSSYYTHRSLFVHGFDLNEPSGYEGEPILTRAPTAKYVAMGDSFSSGEGNSPFENGTDASSNKCHRSPQAYPRLLQNDSNLNLGSTDFVACSGATTDNVLNGQWNEPAQINALSEDTEVVTITIGGNDIGFKDFATACTIGSCDFATTAYSDIHGKIINDLPGELEGVYEAIDGATSSTADIYVVGYPQIAPAEMPTGMNSACYPFNGGADNPDPELNDGATAYAVVSELNSVIHDAVTSMNSTKFHFVDPNLTGSPFMGHDWCQQDRYFVQIGIPIPPSNTEYSFHPNVDGQEAYTTVVGGEIS